MFIHIRRIRSQTISISLQEKKIENENENEAFMKKRLMVGAGGYEYEKGIIFCMFGENTSGNSGKCH